MGKKPMFKSLIPLAVATFAVGTDSLVIAGILPAIADSLDVTVSSAGQLVTVFALTYALAAPIVSAITGTFDRRTVLLAALAVFVVGNIVTAMGTVFSVVMAGRIVSAVGSAVIVSIAMATATAIAPPEKRGRALALVTAGTTVATTLGVPLGTLIGGVDWRITLWTVAVMGVVAAVGIALWLPQVELPATRLRQRLEPLRNPAVLGILSVTLLILTSGYVLYTYIGPVTESATGAVSANLMIVLIAYGAGSLLGNVVSGFMTDRYPPVRVLVLGLSVLVVTLAVTPLATLNLVTVAVWAVIWGVAGWLTGLPQQHRLVSCAPESSAILLGLNVSVLQLGIAIGSGIGGLMLPGGVGALAAISTAMVVAALLVTVLTTRGQLSAARVDQTA